MNSSMTFGLLPAALMIDGDGIKVGITQPFDKDIFSVKGIPKKLLL
jgi:hypothetical protein